MWQLVGKEITDSDVDRLESVVLDVLGSLDLALDLPLEERWLAELHGKENDHSQYLREGLADTLALMASTDEDAGGTASKRQAKRIASALLRKAAENAKLWMSLSDVLPLLSEAAPDIFLDAVEDGLSGDEPVLRELFTDNLSSSVLTGPTSYHTGLLWALEGLAWSPDYFSRSVQLLARLDRLDPGGKLSNRPANSLRRVFVLWNPQTVASLSERFEVLDALRSRMPDISWKLMERVLPKHHDTLSPNHKPTRKTWGWEAKEGATYSDIFEGVNGLVKRMIEDAGSNADRWSDLVSNLANLPIEQQEEICSELRKLARASHGRSVENPIHQALKKVITRHKNYPDADWSLHSSRIEQLEDIADSLEGVTSSWKAKALFDFGTVNQFDGEDWGEKQENLRTAQDKAIEKILLEDDVEAFLEMASQVDRPEALGRSLGRIRLSQSDELSMLSEGLNEEENVLRKMALGYVFALQLDHYSEAIEVLKNGREEGWPPIVCARFLRAFPPERKTWDLLEEFGGEVKRRYWTEFYMSAGVMGRDDILYAVEQLLYFDQAHRAVDLLGMKTHGNGGIQIPTPVTVEVLTAAAQTKPVSGNYPQMFQHHVSSLLDLLYNRDDASRQVLAKLEWMYLPLLHHVWDPQSPQILHQELSNDPSFFVEVVTAVYIPAGTNREDIETTDADLLRARLARYLLESWKTVPGLKEDGFIDNDVLSDWVERTRSMLKEADRLAVGDQQIGRVLQYGPEPDGDKWPAEPIRNVIESAASRDVEMGFEIEVRNSRGTHSVSSQIEQALADKYHRYAKKVRAKWPRTARMLRRIAENSESDAERYARQEELRGDIYG